MCLRLHAWALGRGVSCMVDTFAAMLFEGGGPPYAFQQSIFAHSCSQFWQIATHIHSAFDYAARSYCMCCKLLLDVSNPVPGPMASIHACEAVLVIPGYCDLYSSTVYG